MSLAGIHLFMMCSGSVSRIGKCFWVWAKNWGKAGRLKVKNLRLAHCGTVPTIISSSTGGTENRKPFGPIGELKTGRKGNDFLFV